MNDFDVREFNDQELMDLIHLYHKIEEYLKYLKESIIEVDSNDKAE